MPSRANSAFTVDKRDAEPTAWEGGQMSRTRLTKTFTGELSGTSAVEAIMVGLDDGGPAIYVGVERFDCILDGRKGTFVLLHSATSQATSQATSHGSEGVTSWTIVTGSGTGELAGIRGEGEIGPDHDFVLTYEIDS